jgi:hypothetical protein
MAAAVESKHDVLLESLRKFYTGHPAHHEALAGLLRNEAHISLRIIDWLVTNYSKKTNITYSLVDTETGLDVPFNVFLQYKAQLKSFSKKFFDPFARRERIAFPDGRGGELHTTAGQLNFFRWAIVNGVIEYGRANAAEIEDDMMASIRHRTPLAPAAARRARESPTAAAGSPDLEKPRRKELSRAAVKSCTRTRVRVVFRFK